ncbi:MAG TPA: 16S rRNA (cytosine(967)-C(5))-methyltransferase RsmB [Gammaproteobacteria bacterium]|nr:16S rRNA (cytosine(967)-C(5))-methyltransferase RsmB [Gammaproteobacteria bacterium]
MSAPRVLAVRALMAVAREGRTLTQAADEAASGSADPRDAALVKELCYGTLRWLPRLEAWLAKLVERPLKSADQDVRFLLLLGLYQLAYLRVPAHAAVQQTVEACRGLDKPWASGLVNAVLRRFQREQTQVEAATAALAEARYAHPKWFLEELRRDWPEHWEAMLDAGNERPPFTLRVNRRVQDREAYLARLAGAGMGAKACVNSADGITLDVPVDVAALPGFLEGAVSVQDEGAQLAAELLDARGGMRVLDACAAPGGKTCHLLERYTLQVTAVELEARRAQRIRDNLRRLKLEAQLKVADAAEVQSWWDGEPYERILLDAPCSASGVVRRHPDVKLRRTPEEVAAAVKLQARLLEALWPLLAPGGKLLYVTCSVFRRENAAQIAAFLAGHPDAAALPLETSWGVPAGPGRQVLTGQGGMDGFYYACLEKR